MKQTKTACRYCLGKGYLSHRPKGEAWSTVDEKLHWLMNNKYLWDNIPHPNYTYIGRAMQMEELWSPTTIVADMGLKRKIRRLSGA